MRAPLLISCLRANHKSRCTSGGAKNSKTLCITTTSADETMFGYRRTSPVNTSTLDWNLGKKFPFLQRNSRKLCHILNDLHVVLLNHGHGQRGQIWIDLYPSDPAGKRICESAKYNGSETRTDIQNMLPTQIWKQIPECMGQIFTRSRMGYEGCKKRHRKLNTI